MLQFTDVVHDGVQMYDKFYSGIMRISFSIACPDSCSNTRSSVVLLFQTSSMKRDMSFLLLSSCVSLHAQISIMK